MGKKERIDVYLAREGLAPSRSMAQRLVMAGEVRVNGEMVHKSSTTVEQGSRVEVISGPRFVSRGGEKLDGAFNAFPLDVEGKVCADVGASTGGFTDCLLQHGAVKVYAVDVGHGILHWRLRQDTRVVVMERTNARYLDTLPEEVSLVTMDASFISLRLLLPRAAAWLDKAGQIVALVKPQFEAGRKKVGKGGVVRDPVVHREVVQNVVDFLPGIGMYASGLAISPLEGPKGNREFLLWCTRSPDLLMEKYVLDEVIPLND